MSDFEMNTAVRSISLTYDSPLYVGVPSSGKTVGFPDEHGISKPQGTFPSARPLCFVIAGDGSDRLRSMKIDLASTAAQDKTLVYRYDERLGTVGSDTMIIYDPLRRNRCMRWHFIKMRILLEQAS